MIISARKIWMLLLFLLSLAAGGCANHSPAGEEPWDGDLCLLLRVTTAESAAPDSRAADSDNSPSGNASFEEPKYDPEKLRSLRVIIVNNMEGTDDYNKIIHNYRESLSQPVSNYDMWKKFKVEFSTKYRIYLIGNEEGLADDIKGKIQGFTEGSKYPETGAGNTPLEEMKMSAMEVEAGNHIIDNTGSSKKVIPMTEVFEITTQSKPSDGPQENSITELRNFFLTRAASKFSFHFFRKKEASTDEASTDASSVDNDVVIKSIKITGLGKSQYLFPNNTVYSPAKYITDNDPESGVNKNPDREITSFQLPAGDDNGTGSYVFTLPEGYNVSSFPIEGSTSGTSFEPQIYFPESKGEVVTNNDENVNPVSSRH